MIKLHSEVFQSSPSANKTGMNDVYSDDVPRNYVFTPGFSETGGVRLPPSSFLVLRLPYVYSYDGKHLVCNSLVDHSLSNRCYLGKDAISLYIPKEHAFKSSKG